MSHEILTVCQIQYPKDVVRDSCPPSTAPPSTSGMSPTIRNQPLTAASQSTLWQAFGPQPGSRRRQQQGLQSLPLPPAEGAGKQKMYHYNRLVS